MTQHSVFQALRRLGQSQVQASTLPASEQELGLSRAGQVLQVLGCWIIGSGGVCPLNLSADVHWNGQFSLKPKSEENTLSCWAGTVSLCAALCPGCGQTLCSSLRDFVCRSLNAGLWCWDLGYVRISSSTFLLKKSLMWCAQRNTWNTGPKRLK